MIESFNGNELAQEITRIQQAGEKIWDYNSEAFVSEKQIELIWTFIDVTGEHG